MKVVANLSFFLCISSLLMSVIEASSKDLRTKLSVAKERFTSIKREEIFDFAAAQQQPHRDLKSASVTGLSQERTAAIKLAWQHQQRAVTDAVVHQHHRGLQTPNDEDLAGCELTLEFLYGPNSGCTCNTEEEASAQCVDFVAQNCIFCETLLDGQEVCVAGFPDISFDSVDFSFRECFAYDSGPFDNTLFCLSEQSIDNTCTIHIDGTECSSCTVIDCDDGSDYDIDCSNLISGETWNLCTDDIPETSPFIAAGNNDRFTDLNCDTGNGDADFAGLLLTLCQTFLEDTFGADNPCTCFLVGDDFADFECGGESAGTKSDSVQRMSRLYLFSGIFIYMLVSL
jgi:hypothetical protein